jgi:hypothetical protein
MNRRIGRTGLHAPYVVKLWGVATGAAAVAFAVKYWLSGLHPLLSGPCVLLVFGSIYFAGSAALRLPEAMQLFQAVYARLRRHP